MGRIVTNKHINGVIVPYEYFFDGISSALTENERLTVAKGRIIISTYPEQEGIFILSEDGTRSIKVAQNAASEIPAGIYDWINNEIVPQIKSYADDSVERAFEEFSLLVISSADTMYNDLKGYVDELSAKTETNDNRLSDRIDELSAYTMNMKISDHFMLTEDEYRMLSALGELTVDAEEFFVSRETRILNDLNVGDVIYYSDEIYYCLYEENGSGDDESGLTPTITGTTMEIFYDISGHTIILDSSATVNSHTLEFSDGGEHGGDTEIDGTTIEDNSIYIDTEDEHTLVLGNNYVYDEENNAFIIN